MKTIAEYSSTKETLMLLKWKVKGTVLNRMAPKNQLLPTLLTKTCRKRLMSPKIAQTTWDIIKLKLIEKCVLCNLGRSRPKLRSQNENWWKSCLHLSKKSLNWGGPPNKMKKPTKRKSWISLKTKFWPSAATKISFRRNTTSRNERQANRLRRMSTWLVKMQS